MYPRALKALWEGNAIGILFRNILDDGGGDENSNRGKLFVWHFCRPLLFIDLKPKASSRPTCWAEASKGTTTTQGEDDLS